jgi:hypothetical protein
MKGFAAAWFGMSFGWAGAGAMMWLGTPYWGTGLAMILTGCASMAVAGLTWRRA